MMLQDIEPTGERQALADIADQLERQHVRLLIVARAASGAHMLRAARRLGEAYSMVKAELS